MNLSYVNGSKRIVILMKSDESKLVSFRAMVADEDHKVEFPILYGSEQHECTFFMIDPEVDVLRAQHEDDRDFHLACLEHANVTIGEHFLGNASLA